MRKTAMRIRHFVDDLSREQGYIKYYLDEMMCKLFRDSQRPVRESWNNIPLFSGWCKRFISRAIARKDVSLIYSFAKGSKQSWPPMSDLKKEQALAKHKVRLGRLPVKYFSLFHDDLANTTKKLAKRVFSKDKLGVPTKFIPSGSACLQASRKDGGALSLFSQFHYPSCSQESELGKLRSLNHELFDWRTTEWKDAREIVWDRIGERNPELNLVDVIALAEPGKFRIITKGHGYLYSYLQPLQGQMLSAWKQCFASTMLDSDLSDRINTLHGNVDFFHMWCSGDYEAATDLLNRELTTITLDELPPSNLKDAALYANMDNICRYEDGTEVYSVQGQLMGHPLSFPILCLINLSVYWTAVDRWAELNPMNLLPWDLCKKVRILRYNVLVNGDDILFKCDNDLFRIFNQCASEAGFLASAGKNYLSELCCMINSQVFINLGGKMIRKSYLNQRLVFGTSIKKGGRESELCTPVQLAVSVNDMCKRVPWTRCCIPMCFERFSSKTWRNQGVNWYIPVHLGGYGLDIEFCPNSATITRFQRVLAAMFVHNPSLALSRTTGMDMPSAKYANALAKWRWVSAYAVLDEHESEEVKDAWLERIAYAARCHSASQPPNPIQVIVRGLRRHTRFSPMSIETLISYWKRRLVASALPPCPPLNLLL
jgi:hypothetical protein